MDNIQETDRRGFSSGIRNSIVDVVGNTPLVRINRLFEGPGQVLAKLESANPLGSVKDRIGRAMVEDAEARGLLRPGGEIIEPTSGNTGIALAFIGASRGYKVTLAMPDSMSMERRMTLRALGAELELTPAADGMKGAIARAEELLAERPAAFMPRQFDNPANPLVHYRTTGPEIWEATAGQIDVLVAGVGTGGTVTGVTRFLREHNPDLITVAVEPSRSPVLSGGEPGPHRIQGIGAGFVPGNLDVTLISEIITVEDEAAIDMALRASREEGLFVGISSGANLVAAGEVSRRPELKGKNVVTVVCDIGDRYFSSDLLAPFKG
jgi:cysteine synthase